MLTKSMQVQSKLVAIAKELELLLIDAIRANNEGSQTKEKAGEAVYSARRMVMQACAHLDEAEGIFRIMEEAA